MTLDELTPLNSYINDNDLSYRESLVEALAGKLDVYYVFDSPSYFSYVPLNEFEAGKITDKTWRESPNLIDSEYASCDFVRLGPDVIRSLWGASINENTKYTLLELLDRNTPKGFVIYGLAHEGSGEVTLDNLYANKNLGLNSQEASEDAPSNTAFKVIGLLMHHLAKTPKYSSGDSPNKSQIKELLLDLAEELKVNPYGLSKVDERLLSDAMKYLEDQKN